MVCPNCQNNQSVGAQNFGALYTCNSCQAVYFINFEGEPIFSEITEEVAEEITAERPAIENNQEMGSLEPLVDSVAIVESIEPIANSLDNPFELQNNLSPINSDMENEALSSPVVLDSFEKIAKEITDFGNTDLQLSGMNYDLHISGIDNQETKNLFNEAINDSKFSWDAIEIMKTIKNGSVEILKLSPAKAYILAKRLQFLDIEKRWKQNVLS